MCFDSLLLGKHITPYISILTANNGNLCFRHSDSLYRRDGLSQVRTGASSLVNMTGSRLPFTYAIQPLQTEFQFVDWQCGYDTGLIFDTSRAWNDWYLVPRVHEMLSYAATVAGSLTDDISVVAAMLYRRLSRFEPRLWSFLSEFKANVYLRAADIASSRLGDSPNFFNASGVGMMWSGNFDYAVRLSILKKLHVVSNPVNAGAASKFWHKS